MNIYAVIDTNVIISSMLSVNPNSPTKEVINNVWKDIITPMINAEIIEEYCDVLSRSKFHFKETELSSMKLI